MLYRMEVGYYVVAFCPSWNKRGHTEEKTNSVLRDLYLTLGEEEGEHESYRESIEGRRLRD